MSDSIHRQRRVLPKRLRTIEFFSKSLHYDAADELDRLSNVLEYARNEIRDGNKRIEELEDALATSQRGLFAARVVNYELEAENEKLEGALANHYCELCGCSECLKREALAATEQGESDE